MATARIDRTFDIDISTMWKLWTSPEHLARWFRPSLTDFGPSVASLDLQPGGAYRIEMLSSDGEAHAVVGRVVAVEEPSRIALTWRWDGTDQESLVDVTFADHQGRTAVVIDHTRLFDEADAARHTEGWVGCLSSLAACY